MQTIVNTASRIVQVLEVEQQHSLFSYTLLIFYTLFNFLYSLVLLHSLIPHIFFNFSYLFILYYLIRGLQSLVHSLIISTNILPASIKFIPSINVIIKQNLKNSIIITIPTVINNTLKINEGAKPPHLLYARYYKTSIYHFSSNCRIIHVLFNIFPHQIILFQKFSNT